MEDKGQYNVKDKKIRGRTFLRQEIDTLLEFVKKYYCVIENKGTDAVTWKTKQQCWEKISAEFNSAGIYGRRSATQLHNKWNLLKKTARREYVGEKKYAMGTGGGEYKAPGISDVSKKIHELGAQTIEGGTNEVDCDTVEDEPQAACSNQPAEPSSPQPLEVENVQELLDLESI
ncbi:hypothetical protein JTB14_010589 [Gonioctena quinquepunctata]|nr:hypothetical protein JTB14_010589 [Gonioctena quinquepunctata]